MLGKLMIGIFNDRYYDAKKYYSIVNTPLGLSKSFFLTAPWEPKTNHPITDNK